MSIRCALAALIICASGAALARDVKWPPVEAELLAEKQGSIDPEADVEAVFWIGEREKAQTKTTVRLKIYTARGVQAYSRIELPASPIKDAALVWARTTRPDGSSVELNPDDVYLDELVTYGREQIRRRAFAPPGLEPGCVIDYSWIGAWTFEGLPLQFEIPVRRLEYRMHGAQTARAFLARPTLTKMKKDAGIIIVHENSTALRSEPHDPPLSMHRPWVTLRRSDGDMAHFARDMSMALHEKVLKEEQTSKAFHQAAEGLATPEADAFEVAEAACEWIRERFPIGYSTNPRTGARQAWRYADKEKLRKTFKRLGLKGDSLLTLHAALVRARGFDMRLARAEDRGGVRFAKQHPLGYRLPARLTALPDGEGWRLYDPASSYHACGMVSWRHEVATTIVGDENPRQGLVATSAVQPASKSARLLTADVSLAADGALTGTATLSYTGHFAAFLRTEARAAHEAAREEAGEEAVEGEDEYADLERLESSEAVADYFNEIIEGRLGAKAEGALAVSGLLDPDENIRVGFNVSVPEFGRRTGKRLFFQPSLSTREVGERFPSSERHLPVFFPFPWTEIDSIRIGFPEGFELKDPTAPAPLHGGESVSFSTKLWLAKGDRELQVRRRLSFGARQELLFPVASYPAVKGLFDAIEEADEHLMALQRIPAEDLGP